MIKFSINGKSHNLKNDWSEITISDAIKITALTLPEAMQKPEIKTSDLLDMVSINFAKDVVKILAGVDEETMNKAHAGDIVVLFRNVLQLVVDLFNLAPVTFTPAMPEYFEHNGERFYYPTSQTFNDVLIPSTNLDAVSFVESANLLSALTDVKNEGLKQMPVFIACYCKKQGETFDQFKVLERSKSFGNLPMTVAWEVFFCMVQFLTSQVSAIQNYLEKPKKETIKTVVQDLFRRGFTRQLMKDTSPGIR